MVVVVPRRRGVSMVARTWSTAPSRPSVKVPVTRVPSFIWSSRRGGRPRRPGSRDQVPTVRANGRGGRRLETEAEWRARLGERWPEVAAWRAAHDWHPHRLRHSAATEFRRSGDTEAAKIILDHGSAAMTEHYAEADERKADEVVRRIG